LQSSILDLAFAYFYREAFKIFDRDKDGFISTKELKRVTNMLGTMLTKEEVEEFMAEADLVR
jgi:Ca2+-binding EF-hand superfamily protein